MYAAIGYGGLTAAKAVGRIRDDLTSATRTLAPKPLGADQETPAAIPPASLSRTSTPA